MLDQDDADDAVLIAALSTPASWFGLAVVLIVALVALMVVRDNQAECAQRTCPGGQTPRLMQHDCLCVQKAQQR